MTHSQDWDIFPAISTCIIVENFPITRRFVLFHIFLVLVQSLLGLLVCMSCPASFQNWTQKGMHIKKNRADTLLKICHQAGSAIILLANLFYGKIHWNIGMPMSPWGGDCQSRCADIPSLLCAGAASTTEDTFLNRTPLPINVPSNFHPLICESVGFCCNWNERGWKQLL